MNIRIKRAMLVAGIASAMALPLSSQASDGTIIFTGAVTGSTCTVAIGGTNSTTAGIDTTVALPTVDIAALTNASEKTTAAGTFFSITLSGCTAANDFGGVLPTQVAIYFEAGPNVDEATNGLVNTAATSPSNVEVSLYQATSASAVGAIITPGSTTNQPALLPLASGGTQWFYAGYSTAGNGLATPGAVKTSITYSVVYQ